MKNYIMLSFIVLLFSCKNENSKSKEVNIDVSEQALSANEIVNRSIDVSGGNSFNKSIIRFDFRNKYYLARREEGKFTLMRITSEKNKDSIFDVLTNEGFNRIINGDDSIVTADSIAKKYSASVNSVHYFSVLPYGLNDKSVNKKLLKSEQIKGKDYYKIKVTFNKDGGGEDYEDVFIYWIDLESYKLNYLAYSYNEEDGVGMRFREAYNERFVNGLRLVDYNNYKSEDKNSRLENLGKAFEASQLKLLSKIELENVKVDLIND